MTEIDTYTYVLYALLFCLTNDFINLWVTTKHQ